MRPISTFLSDPLQIFLSLVKNYGIWLPERLFLKMRYRLEMGQKLDLNNPRTFQEKIQWLKLYDRNPEYSRMVDKDAVKIYVSERIGEEYIIPTLGVWDKFDDIDFSKLPDKFVLKTTHGGGSTGVVICKDKSKFDYATAKSKLEYSLNHDIYRKNKEWAYKNVSRRILAEEFLELPDKEDLTDYKIFCFNGEPKYIQVIQDRNTKETIDFFDTDWNHQDFVGLNPKAENAMTVPAPPKKLDEMLRIAKKLAEGTKFVRVDLYSIESMIYFGELTFYPASGYGNFRPDSWARKLGDLLKV